jgi:hypothetical protein
VIGLNSPGWTDDELLNGLRAALREATVDDGIIRAAQAALTWRMVDADLEILGLDADQGLTTAAPARGGGGPVSPRTLTFHGKRLSMAVEIDEGGTVGQLTPPGPGQVTLVTAGGPQATTQADDVGWFTLPPCPPGPGRLECARGADHFTTEWTTL